MKNEYRPQNNFAATRESLSDLFLVGRDCTVLYFIRHGNSEYPSKDNDYDPPLSQRGRSQANLLGKRLGRHGLTNVVCSSTLRCRQTADYIKKYTGLKPTIFPGLEEIMPTGSKEDWAAGFHRISAILRTADKQGFGGKLARAVWRPVSGVESSSAMRRRALKAINGIIQKYAGKKVAVVTHCFYINAYFGELLQKPGYAFFYPDEASISILLANRERRAIYRLNDSSHYSEPHNKCIKI